MKKVGNRKGFTLVEVLVAVVIIAILSAIAIPSLTGANKKLTQRQADDYAKSIYLAVQDNLAGMRTDGSLLTLDSDIYPYVYVDRSEEPPTLRDEITAVLTEEQQAALLTEDLDRDYRFIIRTGDNDADFERILPLNSIDPTILDRQIIVIFSPTTGDVFFVGYGDGVEKHGVVGTYSGSIVQQAEKLKAEETVTPVVSFINSQECQIRIFVPLAKEYTENSRDYYNAISFNVTVADKDDPAVKFTYTFSPLSQSGDFSFNYATGMGTWVLDSLKPGSAFSNKNKSLIAPGKNVLVNVEYVFDPAADKAVDFDTSRSQVAGNPLFAGNDGTVISVANGRNLQNLNKIDSTLASALYAKEGAKVLFTDNIAWGDTVKYYVKNYDTLKTFKAFVPLTAEKLFAEDTKVTVDGNGKCIYNLYVDCDGQAGLFTDLYTDVSSLSFRDPLIKGSGSSGALAGRIYGARVLNCDVAIESASQGVTDEVKKGEKSPKDISGSSNIYGAVSTGDAPVGLLAGEIYKGTVIERNADATVNTITLGANSVPASGTDFGLLVGFSQNSTVQGVTVYGKIEGGMAQNVGLILGRASGSTLTSVYARGSVLNTNTGNGSVGGAVGSFTGTTGGAISGKGAETVNVTLDGVKAAGAGSLCGTCTSARVSEVKAIGTLKNMEGVSLGAVGVANGGTYKDSTAETTADTLYGCALGGFAGYAKGGSFSGLTVTAKLGSVKTGGNNSAHQAENIAGSDVGGLIGEAEGVTVNGTNTVNDNFAYLFNCNSTGGAFGCVSGGSYSGIRITGSMNDIVSCYLGGAVGQAADAGFSDVHSAVDMNVQYVWSLSNSYGPVPADLGAYASPSGLGYAGKFVGYLASGSFKDCSGTGTGTGSNGKYSSMQFVGAVMPTAHNAASTLYEAAKKVSGTIEADSDMTDPTRFRQKDGDLVFTPAKVYYTYDGITLTNCTYLGADGSTYKQTFGTDKVYYDRGLINKAAQYSFVELGKKDYKYEDLTTQFLIASYDNKYALRINKVENDLTALQHINAPSIWTIDGTWDTYKFTSYNFSFGTLFTHTPRMQKLGNDEYDYTSDFLVDVGNRMDKHYFSHTPTVLAKDVIDNTFDEFDTSKLDDISYDPRFDFDLHTTNVYGYNNFTGYELKTLGINFLEGYEDNVLRGIDLEGNYALWENTDRFKYAITNCSVVVKNATCKDENKDLYFTLRCNYRQELTRDIPNDEYKNKEYFCTVMRQGQTILGIQFADGERTCDVNFHTDENGKPYCTISRHAAVGTDCMLAIDGSGTVKCNPNHDSNFSAEERLHLYVLKKTRDEYQITTFTFHEENPSQIITSVKA